MKQTIRAARWSLLLIGSLTASTIFADTIYCEDNKQLICLGFGKKVVNSNDICFDPLKCDKEGFICKSEMDALASEHESLLNQHNELVNTHNQLIDAYEKAQSNLERFQSCVDAATTLEEAQACQ